MGIQSHSPTICIVIAITVWFLITTVSIAGAKVPAIIVFGDSTVDSGNNNFIPTIARADFEPYGRDFPGGEPTGRFSNGRLSSDFISEAYGLKPTVPAYLDPSYNISDFSTGVCFASAGTGYDNATADILGVIPLWKEIEYYKEYQHKLADNLGRRKATTIIREALYVVSIGTNDFLENYFTLPDRRSQFTIQQYQDFLVGIAEGFLRKLYGLGARKMSFTGISPMGCLPLERATNFDEPESCVKSLNDLALEFNGRLKKLVGKLNMELRGMKIFFADPYDIVWELVNRPSVFGLEEAGTACCGTGTFEMGFLCSHDNPFTCTDADAFVFWDAFHPTQRTNQIVSDYFLSHLKLLFP
ncbi:PREDICTED: GDSL esterase/lipase At2g42990 [Tarenaya hassleriana]|uniref:GDSL esterase/lipase At2g42990 n=1 Tax=Tarenaya hassleriana TaxID=28532 RepID=UPI00053C794C|nr:PREDICTED: GDSL esterase/lipase At2g42990 [Tarenaya hassleriana]